MNIKEMKWIRAPKQYVVGDDSVEIITEPFTDLWQRTYYHFRNDNAPALQMSTTEKFFSFVVKTDFAINETYTITIGEDTYSATLTSIGTALGMNAHGGGNQGFGPPSHGWF